ncbi:MAG: 30S ribosomal protein S20 [Brevibacterium yomogidense]|uniref:Small ribosomal subunit protein bS20 n=1 Tax=Brevibacterium yomogidense TaxID=946573 RepID=A0A1X6XFV7_9MICO|nr:MULTISPECIES: 30S ribosomal protein S20 [Brevibacterium]SLM98154.1 SSU ribosomal protein S20p [Brevibacterium yomogidense]
MANIKSQIKRNLTNEKARLRNREVRSEVKTAIRAVREQIAAGDTASAQTALQNASRKLDKAVSKGVLHKNNAANRKSNLAKKVNAL